MKIALVEEMYPDGIEMPLFKVSSTFFSFHFQVYSCFDLVSSPPVVFATKMAFDDSNN